MSTTNAQDAGFTYVANCVYRTDPATLVGQVTPYTVHVTSPHNAPFTMTVDHQDRDEFGFYLRSADDWHRMSWSGPWYLSTANTITDAITACGGVLVDLDAATGGHLDGRVFTCDTCTHTEPAWATRRAGDH